MQRMLPYWYDSIVPDLLADRVVLVTAHGNSLRALVKHLDGLSEEAVVGLNIPTGIPLVYELDDDLKPTVKGGMYLDPDAAQKPSRLWRTKEDRPRLAAVGRRLPRPFEARRRATPQRRWSTNGACRWPRN